MLINNTLLAIGISLSTSIVLILALLASFVLRRINAETASADALRQSEERFRSLVQNSSDMMTILSVEKVILYESPSIKRILGYKPEELEGKNGCDYIHPEDAPAVEAAFDKLIKNPGIVVSIEYRFRHKDNSWVELESVANNFLENASVKGIAINSRDITGRKHSEKILKRYQLLSEQARDIVLFVRPEGEIIEANNAAIKAYGYQREELLSLKIHDIRAPETHALLAEQMAQADKKGILFETIHRRKDGSTFPVEVSSQGTVDGNQRVLFSIIREISERKQAEIALQKQAERERLIGAIAQPICQSLNLDKILNTTVAEVRQFLKTDRVVIYRFNFNGSGIVVAESVDSDWDSMLGTVIDDHCFAQSGIQLNKQCRLRATEDIYAAGLTQCHIDLLARFQVRASLVVPILQSEQTTQNSTSPYSLLSKKNSHIPNQLWGLLIAYQCRSPRQWQDLEIDLLKQLATSVAIAIQQSELYQQVQLLNADLELQVQERTAQLQQARDFDAMLKRITDKVRDSLEEDQILQTAVRELVQVLNLVSCNSALYNLEQGTATICYEYQTSRPFYKARVLQMGSFPEIYNPLLQGECFQFCSLLPNPIRGQVAMLACPIFDDRGVLGDLWLVHRHDYGFNNLEIGLVQQVANQCAIAIRQARLYQAVQAQVVELERLNRLKDDFLSTVSHELRTPVANMKMAMQMLEIALNQERASFSEIPNLQAQQSKTSRYLQILKNECERENRLINELLDLQKLDAGSQSLVLTAMQLQDWLPQIVEPFQERIKNHQQTLQINISTDMPDLVSDPSSLERIVAELLNNACKYTPPGEEIIITASAKSGKIELSVSNSGVEIAPSELPRIFDKFYRIPSADPWKQGGTGLGLALVKTLTEHLGGKIWVESGSGQTCFKVELPIKGRVQRLEEKAKVKKF
ncbi:MAG: PAS domain S-box protein [Aphanothece sp. CMT-3BRIN-NPC111]|jgi:PAS domain S-box-containing protein|nr:PAS domain S-box protein [Aphanothece sp. CMT-3BRIN-NPC111]